MAHLAVSSSPASLLPLPPPPQADGRTKKTPTESKSSFPSSSSLLLEHKKNRQKGGEMEEALEAAATVIKYVGEAVISSKCAELSALVEGVEQAAEAAGVQHEEISRLSDELKHANERDRMTAIVNLGDASAAMERIARAPLVALRDSTARLVRECRDFREAYQSIENLQRAKAQRAQDRAGRPPGSGWLSIWGRLGTRRGIRESLLTDVEKGHQSSKVRNNIPRSSLLLLPLHGSP